MIRVPTVYIIGAGASVPFQFPDGRKMRLEARKLSVDQLVEQSLAMHKHQVEPLFRALRNALDGSIDSLLETRPDLARHGKCLIARMLLNAERGAEQRHHLDDEDWLGPLYTAMRTGTLSEFAKNQVTFVTYNYDRLLEHRFVGALAASFGEKERNCAEVFQKMGAGKGVIHLHGQLGVLPAFAAPNAASIGFGGDPSASSIQDEEVKDAAQYVRIVHEPDPNDQPFADAREALCEAERVVFLGFGYGQTNMERLQLAKCVRPGPKLYGTAMGFTPLELSQYVQPHFHGKWDIQLTNYADDIKALFRRLPVLL